MGGLLIAQSLPRENNNSIVNASFSFWSLGECTLAAASTVMSEILLRLYAEVARIATDSDHLLNTLTPKSSTESLRGHYVCTAPALP